MDPQEMAERRAAMFTPPLIYILTRRKGPTLLGPDTLITSVDVHNCNECGAMVESRQVNAHFGWHLKIDNIDQRVAAHRHPRSHDGVDS